MTDSVEERVARGAALLDAQVPNWWERIRVLDLDMARGCACVLGQVFANDATRYQNGYDIGVNRLNSDRVSVAVSNGFDSYGTAASRSDDFEALRISWTRVIESRRVSQ